MSARPLGSLEEPEAKDLGAFQVLPQNIGDRVVVALIVILFVFGVSPDIAAWAQGKPPVGVCR